MSVHPHAPSRNADEAASWRQLAEQRDASLREQERLIASLESTIDRLEATQAELAATNHRLRAEIVRLADEAAAERKADAATRATLAYRMALRLRNWFPVGSRRGMLARAAFRPLARGGGRSDSPA